MKLRIRGADQAAQSLAQLPGEYRAALRRAAPDIIDPATQALAVYPPPRQYQRTGDLGDGWRTSPIVLTAAGDGLLITRENPVSYSDDVQTAAEQAPIHQGWWQTTETVASDQEAATRQRTETALDQVTRRRF